MNGNMFFIRDVIALFIKYLKDELMKALQLSNVTLTDFHWVITVPAIWSASGKQMMREAAYQVNNSCMFDVVVGDIIEILSILPIFLLYQIVSISIFFKSGNSIQ